MEEIVDGKGEEVIADGEGERVVEDCADVEVRVD